MTSAALFAKVVEAKGFSAAARAIGIPKTTISKKVADLEAELGVRLLNRTTRKLSLTDAGARIYEHCVAAVRHMEDAEREAHAMQNVPGGMLTVATPGSVGVPFLLPAIGAFMEKHPDVQVTLLSENRLIDIDEEHIDVMIWPGALPQSVHTVRLVAQVHIGLYASESYLQTRGTPHTPTDLADHAVVAFVQIFNGNKFVWNLERGAEKREITPRIQPCFRSNDAMAVLSHTIAGYGIGALPTRFVSQIPEAQALRQILTGWEISPIQLNAVLRDTSSLKTKLFVSFMAKWFSRLDHAI